MSFHSQRFGRAAQTYGAHAEVQERMAERLAGLRPEFPATVEVGAARILEMGSGTGLLTRALSQRLPQAVLTVTDASEPMLALSRENLGSRPGTAFSIFDASGQGIIPPIVQASAPFDLAASNALVQWFPDLGDHLRMVAALLGSKGTYLVSGFLRDNFPELNALLAGAPFRYRDFPGHVCEEVSEAAREAGFAVEAWEADVMEFVYPSPEAFLGAIRGLGSSRRPEAAAMTRSRLEYLVTQYQERYACDGGVKVTWKPWFARLSKRGNSA